MKHALNKDAMLEAVLSDSELMEHYGYTKEDIGSSIYDALNSDIPVVHAVALIINEQSDGADDNTIYKRVLDYLQTNL